MRSPSKAIFREFKARTARSKRLLKSSQRDPGPDNIHDVRVSIRRLIAALDLCAALHGSRVFKKLKKRLKSVMGPLGDLRDIHVQIDLISGLNKAKASSLRAYQRDILRKVPQSEKKVFKALSSFKIDGIEEFEDFVGKTKKECAPDNIYTEEEMTGLVAALKGNAKKCKERYLKDRSIASFHKLRIAFKKLRYTCELVLPATERFKKRDVENIHSLQTEMGDIHDVDVLYKDFCKFAGKKAKMPDSIKERKSLKDKRDCMLDRFNVKIKKKEILPEIK